MSDELEPFRRAAELGCEDFCLLLGEVCFAIPDAANLKSVQVTNLPVEEDGGERINRYAAAVCAEWWQKQMADNEFGVEGATKAAYVESANMIDLCREFARKHGEGDKNYSGGQ